MSCPVLLVPRRAGIPDRDRLWAWLRTEWWPQLGWPIVEGHHDDGPFSRSRAVNRAAEIAADSSRWRWDVAVVIDADTIIDHHAVRSAALLAAGSGQITWGFDRWAALSPEMTDRVLGGYQGDWNAGVTLEFRHSASSCVAVPRQLWDRVGGFDEQFVGWGFEDVAFSLACQAIGGGGHRIAGTAFHLHHAPAEATGDTGHPIYLANQERCRPYLDAYLDPVKMEAALRANGQWERFA